MLFLNLLVKGVLDYHMGCLISESLSSEDAKMRNLMLSALLIDQLPMVDVALFRDQLSSMRFSDHLEAIRGVAKKEEELMREDEGLNSEA